MGSIQSKKPHTINASMKECRRKLTIKWHWCKQGCLRMAKAEGEGCADDGHHMPQEK